MSGLTWKVEEGVGDGELRRGCKELVAMAAPVGEATEEEQQQLVLPELEGRMALPFKQRRSTQKLEEGATDVSLAQQGLKAVPELAFRVTSLVSLDLSYNQLESLPEAISKLQNLEVLDVSVNALEELPDSIGSLSKLRVLNASRNHLHRLPESICFCNNLEELRVNFNHLTYLPQGLGNTCPNLRILFVGLNKLKLLPRSIANLEHLEVLDAHFNMIKEVPASFGKLKKLRSLNLSSNFSDLKFLPLSLGNVTTLRELNLMHNQLKELPVSFGRLTKLETLELEGNPLENPPYELVEKKDHAALMKHVVERYEDSLRNPPPPPSLLTIWAEWLQKLLAGEMPSLDQLFGRYLPEQHNMQQLPGPGGEPQHRGAMEMANVGHEGDVVVEVDGSELLVSSAPKPTAA